MQKMQRKYGLKIIWLLIGVAVKCTCVKKNNHSRETAQILLSALNEKVWNFIANKVAKSWKVQKCICARNDEYVTSSKIQ